MPSNHLENYQDEARRPSERVLMLLKMHGSLTSAALGAKLGTTAEAARQQLARLSADGLVAMEPVRSGPGRPRQTWSLTPSAQDRFPDTHAALTVELLDGIRAALGEAALDAVIAEREGKTLDLYRSSIDPDAPLATKVSRLAEIRSAEGYMAEWRDGEDEALILIENHCPICAAASACQGFCRAELQLFRALLGPTVSVERTEHILSEGRRCAYVIRKR